MGAPVKWGVILAVIVTIFNAVWVLAGLHTSVASATGYLVLVIIVDIVDSLCRTLQTSVSRSRSCHLSILAYREFGKVRLRILVRYSVRT